ncbi:MAG: hypothetical protein NT062_11930 [Proteobacteria bacterium]|nr:hypothetical protein [Pseudomonadota bacterium]
MRASRESAGFPEAGPGRRVVCSWAIPPPIPTSFTSRTPFLAEHPQALAFYCSDGRFTNPVEELLHELGHARLDTLTMPGGAALLNGLTAKFGDLDAARRAASFLIEGHDIREVFLIAHEGCGYYRRRMAGKSAVEIEAAQANDLQVAAKLLVRAHPTITTHAYFARVIDAHVRFDQRA